MSDLSTPTSGGSPAGDALHQAAARAGRDIRIALCAIIVAAAAFAVAACPNPVLVPEAEACIVSVRGVKTDSESHIAIAMRVTVKGSLSLERFGITVRAASDRRSYWHTDVIAEEVPAGASVILETAIPFDSADEAYVDGSAVIESTWFE